MARAPQPTQAINASSLSIRQLFGLGRFEPARAQREYQWGRAQWEDLLSDFISALRISGRDPEPASPNDTDPTGAKAESIDSSGAAEPIEPLSPPQELPRTPRMSEYYLGHVLLLPRQTAGQFLIYDGQQRLTTLTILLSALRDVTPRGGDWLGIQEALRTPSGDPRLTVATNGRALGRIGGVLDGTRPPNNTSAFEPADHRMFGAAHFLRSALETWAPARVKALADFLLDDVFVTVTQMRERRVAEYAYITINTRGKALENKDIIKGHFTQLASQRSLTAANEMAQLWDKLEESAAGRLETIIKIAFMLDYRQSPAFNFGAQLMDYFEDPSRLDEVFEWVGQRLPAIVHYHKTLVLELQRQTVLKAPAVHLRRMSFLPWAQWQAVAFKLAERDKKAPKRFEKSMQALEQWSFCANLLGMDERTISDKTLRALNQIHDGLDPFSNGGALRLSVEHQRRVPTQLQDGQITDLNRPENLGGYFI